jgi:hypothetical protein
MTPVCAAVNLVDIQQRDSLADVVLVMDVCECRVMLGLALFLISRSTKL